MTGFLHIQAVMVPRQVIEDGQEFMRAAGGMGREGMVLWAGRPEGPTFRVTDLVIPQQKGVSSRDGVCVIVEGVELARLNMELHKRQLQFIAQVHSHPGAAYHSEMDDEFAVATKIGCFSLVVPDFAKRPFSFNETAIYRINSAGEWLDAPRSLFHIAGEGGYYGAC
ncbi:Mov34/MPN/PAD-1 family protein [Candidatus Ferrigenium straubiae]|jgi:hypothetical protein|uniref:Mov34/MPN/PAD-1 family protein n=1 Tax=Candidatus Ferrigenium straubiae TaxID=2919506 RepID=UPI003F4AA78A